MKAREDVRVKLLAQDREMYVFAESRDPHRQRAQHASPAVEMVVATFKRALNDAEAHSRNPADEARCCTG